MSIWTWAIFDWSSLPAKGLMGSTMNECTQQEALRVCGFLLLIHASSGKHAPSCGMKRNCDILCNPAPGCSRFMTFTVKTKGIVSFWSFIGSFSCTNTDVSFQTAECIIRGLEKQWLEKLQISRLCTMVSDFHTLPSQIDSCSVKESCL